MLGHISDLFSEIYGIDIVVVYSPRWDGYKLSIRSYHDYLTAEELVKDLTSTVGTGGGHQNKAGSYIFKRNMTSYSARFQWELLSGKRSLLIPARSSC